MERICGIGEHSWDIAAGLGPVIVRMEHNVCTLIYSDSHSLRVSSTFVANRNTEGELARVEDPAPCARGENLIFGRIKLYFVLPALRASVRIEHEGSNTQPTLNDPFRTQYHCKVGLARRSGYFCHSPLKKFRITRLHGMWSQPIARHKLFRKAKYLRAGFRGFRNGVHSQMDGLVRCCGKVEVGESNANHANSLLDRNERASALHQQP